MHNTKPELVVNFSGGKDSTALLAWVVEHYPAHRIHVVMADTGWEHPDAEEWARGIVARFGLQLHVVRNARKTFLQMVERRGKFPSAQHRQCTSDLKRDPINRWIRNHCGPLVVSCMGLRAEESASRAKQPRLKRCRKNTNSRRTVWIWNPILHWTEQQVRAYLAQRQLPLHPVYQWLPRFSCRVCIFHGPRELRQVAKHDPQALQAIVDLETRLGFSMNPRGYVQDLLAGSCTEQLDVDLVKLAQEPDHCLGLAG